MSSNNRCAACKYLRRRCVSDCIFSPYFPPNNPQRFAFVHRIYGASNVGKMLQQLPVHLRADAADSLYYEAQCRFQDPVYGCVGIISILHQQIYDTQSELAKIQAEIAFINAQANQSNQQYHYYQQHNIDDESSDPSSFGNFLHDQNVVSTTESSVYEHSSNWFNY